MSLDFLSQDEVFGITKRRRWTAQLRVLRELGFTARPDGDGRPLVLRSHVEAKFGIHHEHRARKFSEPDWTYLDATKAASR